VQRRRVFVFVVGEACASDERGVAYGRGMRVSVLLSLIRSVPASSLVYCKLSYVLVAPSPVADDARTSIFSRSAKI